MSESVSVENKEQAPQKPPRSLGRIAGEILAGTATGLAVELSVGSVIRIQFDNGGQFGRLVGLGMFSLLFPTLYGLGSAVGVYLVGSIGKQSGSFFRTLGCGFLGGVLVIMLFCQVHRVEWLYCVPSMPRGAFEPLVLLIPPLMATCAFNLTRRYKEPVSPGSSSRKYFTFFQ